MNNIGKFIVQAFLAMLIINIFLGLLFCLATGSMAVFVPFVEFGIVVSIIYCISIIFLSKA